MLQEVACHEGKCWELKKKEVVSFESLFEEENIVDEIEKDLWSNTAYGH